MILASSQNLELTEGNAPFITELRESPVFSVTAPNATLRLASQIALQNLASVPSFLPVLYAVLQPLLLKRAASTAVNDISSKDLAIWQTPANVEWKPVQDDVGYVADQSGTKVNRKGVKSDDAWAAELQVGV